MSFDGIVTRAMVHECQALLPSKIVRVHQPSAWELSLRLRGRAGTVRLLLSAHPIYARFHLVDAAIPNPPEPPMFCQLLRKWLEGASLVAVEQPGLERMVRCTIRSTDTLGNSVMRWLVLEIMGRHSNLLFIDPAQRTLLDGLRRVSGTMSRHRQVYPGAAYVTPPTQDKLDPLTVEESTFLQGLDYNAGRLDNQLVKRFQGIGPLLARSLVAGAGLGAERGALWAHFSATMERVRRHEYTPNRVTIDNKVFFHALPLSFAPSASGAEPAVHVFPTLSACLVACHTGAAERDRHRSQAAALLQHLEQALARQERKIAYFREQLASPESAEEKRHYGELLTSQLHRIQRGATEVEVVDYHDPAQGRKLIPLQPLLTPSENAQYYFRQYRKLQRAQQWHQQELERAQQLEHYLASVVVQLEQGGGEQVPAIREELRESGWLKAEPQKASKKSSQGKKQGKAVPVLPLQIQAADGTVLYVGRNNRQNDHLTHRIAQGKDTWLHAQNIPGAHVVIRSTNVSEATLQEAAALAAYFSKARSSSQVPVDYTLIKHVRKPAGAPPGAVHYRSQRTLWVTPDEAYMQRWLSQ